MFLLLSAKFASISLIFVTMKMIFQMTVFGTFLQLAMVTHPAME